MSVNLRSITKVGRFDITLAPSWLQVLTSPRNKKLNKRTNLVPKHVPEYWRRAEASTLNGERQIVQERKIEMMVHLFGVLGILHQYRIGIAKALHLCHPGIRIRDGLLDAKQIAVGRGTAHERGKRL